MHTLESCQAAHTSAKAAQSTTIHNDRFFFSSTTMARMYSWFKTLCSYSALPILYINMVNKVNKSLNYYYYYYYFSTVIQKKHPQSATVITRPYGLLYLSIKLMDFGFAAQVSVTLMFHNGLIYI